MFVKSHDEADPRMFACEARGLDWLREAGAIRIPRVLAYGQMTTFGVLRRVRRGCARRLARAGADRDSAARAADYDASASARGLDGAASSPAMSVDGRFGFTEPNFIGSLTQDNTFAETWPEFYVTRRLEPQVRAAIDRGSRPRRGSAGSRGCSR